MVSMQPITLQESLVAGHSWAEQLGHHCMQEIMKEHPEMMEAIEKASGTGQPQK
jgi:hypothetical protein